MKNAIGCALLCIHGCLVAGCGGGGSDTSDDPASSGSDTYAFLREGSIDYEDMPTIWATLPYTSISLERQGCFGACPVYTVTLERGSGTGTGSASYSGRDFAAREGSFSGQIEIWDYGHLCELVDRFGFYELEENYSAGWTDDATAIVEASRATSTHRVLDYGRQGPPELVALQLAIDAIADRIDWVGGDSPPLPPTDD